MTLENPLQLQLKCIVGPNGLFVWAPAHLTAKVCCKSFGQMNVGYREMTSDGQIEAGDGKSLFNVNHEVDPKRNVEDGEIDIRNGPSRTIS